MSIQVPVSKSPSANLSTPPENSQTLPKYARTVTHVALIGLTAYGSYLAFSKGINLLKKVEIYLPNNDAIDSWTRVIQPSLIDTIKGKTCLGLGGVLSVQSIALLCAVANDRIRGETSYTTKDLTKDVTITAGAAALGLSVAFMNACLNSNPA